MFFEDSDSEVDEVPEIEGSGLMISKREADENYSLAGSLVDEPPDELNLVKYECLLSDNVHKLIMEVLNETKLGFQLADFQMLSLHVLGSKKNLILISPTGSGKMLGR